MNAVLVSILMFALPIAIVGEWWRLRTRYLARVRDVQGRRMRERMRADEALSAAKRQISSLQHQLTGARLQTKRAERNIPPVSEVRVARSVSRRSPLLMLDEYLPDSKNNGFADTKIGY